MMEEPKTSGKTGIRTCNSPGNTRMMKTGSVIRKYSWMEYGHPFAVIIFGILILVHNCFAKSYFQTGILLARLFELIKPLKKMQ